MNKTAFILGFAATGVGLTCQPVGPALVGYGCEGAHGPIYANEEDHFPRCEVIEPVEPSLVELVRRI